MFKLTLIAGASTTSLMLLYPVVFIQLERLFTSKPQARWCRGSLTDARYWFLLSPVSQLYSLIVKESVSKYILRQLVCPFVRRKAQIQ
jgi:hypothetical protein